MKHCCLGLEGTLAVHGSPFRYIPYERQYIVEYNSVFTNEDTGKTAAVVASTLTYCPWCGKKFPKDLIDEWEQEVKKFNINTLDNQEIKELPEEYQTEKWWRKKGF